MAHTGHQSSQTHQHAASSRRGHNSAKRGFASMDPARQREIASAGGRAAHAAGTAHEFTSEEAREAGRHSHANNNRAPIGVRSQGAPDRSWSAYAQYAASGRQHDKRSV
jgi:general stress protein YciG